MSIKTNYSAPEIADLRAAFIAYRDAQDALGKSFDDSPEFLTIRNAVIEHLATEGRLQLRPVGHPLNLSQAAADRMIITPANRALIGQLTYIAFAHHQSIGGQP